jgi:hypothetical protein
MLSTGHFAMWTILVVDLFNSIMFPSIFTLGVQVTMTLEELGVARQIVNRGLFDHFWSRDARVGYCLRVRRPGSGSEVIGGIFRGHQEGKGKR